MPKVLLYLVDYTVVVADLSRYSRYMSRSIHDRDVRELRGKKVGEDKVLE